MKTRLRLAAFGMAATILLALAIAPAALAAPAQTQTTTRTASSAKTGYTVPLTGTIIQGATGTFNGFFTIQRFVAQGQNLVAEGMVNGTLTDSSGNVIGTVTNQPAAFPVADPNSSCSILNLTLGPIYLNLLGLVVQTNTIHLTITAQQGPGNLLGNLLCAVVNLLNNGGPTTGIAALLNRILGVLSSL